MKTPPIDSKRRAAGERDDEGAPKQQTVRLISEDDVPAVTRTGKRSALLESPEWRQATELMGKGIPEKKVVVVPLGEQTLKLAKTPKHSAIAFKRHLMTHVKRMAWKFNISLKGTELYVKNEVKKSK
jgi:hypothetical protein